MYLLIINSPYNRYFSLRRWNGGLSSVSKTPWAEGPANFSYLSRSSSLHFSQNTKCLRLSYHRWRGLRIAILGLLVFDSPLPPGRRYHCYCYCRGTTFFFIFVKKAFQKHCKILKVRCAPGPRLGGAFYLHCLVNFENVVFLINNIFHEICNFAILACFPGARLGEPSICHAV